MTRLWFIGWIATLALTSCVPYPQQIGLITEPTIQYGFVVGEIVGASPKPIFRVKALNGTIIADHFCFAPVRFDVVQGPMGSLLWTRDSFFEFEMEAVVRPTISEEDLRAIQLFLLANAPRPSGISPCPTQVLRISALSANASIFETSFGYGRDGANIDTFILRSRGAYDKKRLLLLGLETPTGVMFAIDYRVGEHPDIFNAIIRLRSSTH